MIDVARLLPHQHGQLGQNSPDFVSFIQLQFAPAVVKLNSSQRFNKDGRSAGALIVHHALNSTLEISFDRDHVAPGSLGNQGLLQILAVLG